MHVDDGRRVLGNEGFGEDLHVPRQNYQLYVQGVQQSELPGLGIGAGGGGDWNVFEADAVECGELFHVAVVGDDGCDLAGQFACAGAVEQIGNAMQVLRAEEHDAWTLAGQVQLPAHLQLFGERRKGSGERGDTVLGRRLGGCLMFSGICAAFERPLDAHEEQAQFVILVLVGVKDVRALRVEQACDARHQALAIRAVDQQDCPAGAGRGDFARILLLVLRHGLQIT